MHGKTYCKTALLLCQNSELQWQWQGIPLKGNYSKMNEFTIPKDGAVAIDIDSDSNGIDIVLVLVGTSFVAGWIGSQASSR